MGYRARWFRVIERSGGPEPVRSRPPLCATASRSSGRDGRMLRRAEPENVMDCDLPRRPGGRDGRRRMHFPVPVPTRCREPGNGNWEVGALTALTALAPVLL